MATEMFFVATGVVEELGERDKVNAKMSTSSFCYVYSLFC
jgi:hypothetical protein